MKQKTSDKKTPVEKLVCCFLTKTLDTKCDESGCQQQHSDPTSRWIGQILERCFQAGIQALKADKVKTSCISLFFVQVLQGVGNLSCSPDLPDDVREHLLGVPELASGTGKLFPFHEMFCSHLKIFQGGLRRMPSGSSWNFMALLSMSLG